MVYRRIVFPYVEFQAIARSFRVGVKSVSQTFGTHVYAPALYVCICVGSEPADPYLLNDVHYRMMHNPVWIIRQLVYCAFLWLMHGHRRVFRRLERPVKKALAKIRKFLLAMLVVSPYCSLVLFALPRLFIGKMQVLNRTDLLEQISLSFHFFCFAFSRLLRLSYQRRDCFLLFCHVAWSRSPYFSSFYPQIREPMFAFEFATPLFELT